MEKVTKKEKLRALIETVVEIGLIVIATVWILYCCGVIQIF